MAESRLTEHAVAQQERPVWMPVEESGEGVGPVPPPLAAGTEDSPGSTLPNGDPPAWMLWGVEDES
jgi:hypothetical protein